MNPIAPNWLRALSRIPCALASCCRVARSGFGARDWWRACFAVACRTFLCVIRAQGLIRCYGNNPPPYVPSSAAGSLRPAESSLRHRQWDLHARLMAGSSIIFSCRMSRSLFEQFPRKNPARGSHARNRMIKNKTITCAFSLPIMISSSASASLVLFLDVRWEVRRNFTITLFFAAND